MNVEEMLYLIGEYEYIALFLLVFIGFNGTPIPDDLLTMIGGWAAGANILSFWPAFIVTYVGVISAITLCYFLGKKMGSTFLLKWAAKKPKRQKAFQQSIEWFERYGAWTLTFGYLLPIVRHILPFIAGTQQMSFKKYSIYSFSAAFVWTVVHYLLGYYFGHHMEEIVQVMEAYGNRLLLFVAVTLTLIGIIHKAFRYVKGIKGDKKLDDKHITS